MKAKYILDLSIDSSLNNKKVKKENNNFNILKDTTIDTMNNSCNLLNNLCTIEEKYYKYKNFENPFTIPEIPKNTAKERRCRIINKINKERMSNHSKSVDNAIYKNKLHIKNHSHLENNLFEEIKEQEIK